MMLLSLLGSVLTFVGGVLVGWGSCGIVDRRAE